MPVIKTNTPNGISWRGSVLGGAFAGVHIIQFLDSKITPDGTTFVHGEDYDGWMTWLFSEGPFGIGRKNVMRMFEGYSLDVKARAEALKKQKAEFARVERDTKASRVAGKSELTRH